MVGKCALVRQLDQAYAYASYLIRIRPKSINHEFLVSLLGSSAIREQMFDKAKSSAGINNINSKELGELRFSLPTLPEQQEIVRLLDSLFEQEQKARL